jgi:hypothetical protein
MGIQVTYRRMSESEVSSLEADPDYAMRVLFQPPGIDPTVMAELMASPETMQERAAEILNAMQSAEADTTRLDIDSEWHALHYLLTGDTSMEPAHDPDDPLHNVVMGGHPTEIEATYGSARCFSQVDISDIVQVLSEITVDELRSRFSPDDFNVAKIYPNPQPGGWSKDEIEGVCMLLPRLQRLFEDALDANELVLVYAA